MISVSATKIIFQVRVFIILKVNSGVLLTTASHIQYPLCNNNSQCQFHSHLSTFPYAPQPQQNNDPLQFQLNKTCFRSMQCNSCLCICCPLFHVISPLYLIKKEKSALSCSWGKYSGGDSKHLFVQMLEHHSRDCVSLCQIKHFPFCFYLSLVVQNVSKQYG